MGCCQRKKQSRLSSIYDVFSSFFFLLFFCRLLDQLSYSSLHLHLLVYRLRILFSILFRCTPFRFGLPFFSFPSFSFIVGRDAILLNMYAYAMQIRKRISVAALEWSGC